MMMPAARRHPPLAGEKARRRMMAMPAKWRWRENAFLLRAWACPIANSRTAAIIVAG